MKAQVTLMTRSEYAAEARVGKATVERWAAQGIGPQPIRLGPRLVRYLRSDVDAWLRGQIVDEENK